jgi:cytochrome c oxidase subunit 1
LTPALAHPDIRRLAAGWLLLALSALVLSTLCAVLLIASRSPLLGTVVASGDLFGRALVLHVSLAVVVWFLACAAAFWTMAGGAAASPLRWAALVLATAGLGAMVVSLFFGAAQPVLANYVPVLDHPVFLAGLGLFVVGVGLCGAASVRQMMRGLAAGPVWRVGALLSVLVAAVAVGALIASFSAVAGLPTNAGRFELLAWGPGHVLQFLHVILLMSVWTVLGEQLLGQALAPRRWLVGLLLLAGAPVLAVPFIYVGYAVDSADFRRAFTLLMAYGAWPAAALLALRLLLLLKRAGRAVWTGPHAPALLLSALLFLLGCVLGVLIRGDSTMIPAHYHGTVGAVTLAYMALGYRLLPAFGASLGSAAGVRWQPLVYGSGLMILALALAWSGSLGVPRKTLHVDVIVQYPAYFAAMGLAGVGGLLAICGAVMFIVNVLRSLRARTSPTARRPQRRDVRWPAIGLTIGLTAAFGLLLANWPVDNGVEVIAAKAVDPRADASGHAAQMRNEEVSRLFAQGVALLNAKQFEAAASELHRVLKLAPNMPEAHVNMGFAMLGVQQYAMARDFFYSAIEININQVNAYYGLAMSLESLGDVGGALGAMRTYVHLSKSDDPFLRKANAAIWEWEEDLKASRQVAGTESSGKSPKSQNKP